MSKTNLNLNKQIIALFSGQAEIVSTPKLYIRLTGSHTLAVILSQCVFWSNKSKYKDGWFYKKYEDWFDEIHVSERTLRRRFDKLEARGFIKTKVKMVQGKNIKHIKPDLDFILESISNMLNTDCPNRPHCPDEPNIEQNTCTKIAPTGHSGRSEPANLAGSTIYTEENIQTTNCVSSSSFIFSETIDRDILAQKLFRDERTDAEFMDHAIFHVDNHSDKKLARIVRAQGVLKLLKRMKNDNVIFEATGKAAAHKQEQKKLVSTPNDCRNLALIQTELEKYAKALKDCDEYEIKDLTKAMEYEQKRELHQVGYKSEYLNPVPELLIPFVTRPVARTGG